ncbi:M3 family metallopeptidase [Stenotrophomonas sp. S41]|uniref:M3 family metallopeptidase n=1 Tax=Stenotrophomonas sp. S41 TaxID=2767464 RepID=UPI00190E1A18|nr:M3 family metallopeptidase [Stenotrophomonas sp. S41]MBK0010796.1 M3 family metallopeptidase [Stenotrophomonas sp. S41]
MVFRACVLSAAIAASLITVSAPVAAQAPTQSAHALSTNPLIGPWSTPEGTPPYDRIRPEHYEPAFDEAIAEARAQSTAIADDKAAPTFENTIEAMERSGRQLARVSSTFFTVASADATPANQAIQKNIAPKLARLSNETLLNQKLFKRVDSVFQASASLGLDPEQLRLVEETHARFVRAGAALSPEARARVAAINEQLAKLGVEFGQKLLADQKANDVWLTAEEVKGLPADQASAARAAATAAGKQGAYLFPATRSAAEPFLTSSPNRQAREKIWRAFTYRGDNDNGNNTGAVITQLVTLRAERAKLMGATSHADFVLADSMAKTTDAANDLLMAVYRPALSRAKEELADIQSLATRDGITQVEPWDWRFYAEKIRSERFSLDEAEVRQYMPLDGMVDALFETTRKLFGLTAVERHDIAPYAPGVRVFEIREADGSKLGLFYADWYARPTKRPGAWMNSIRVPNTLLGDAPIVVNNQNIPSPADGQRTLISLDEAQTLFHEFGHGLHGLLSTARYPSLSGTAVSRDFVEFPSQVYEHWITDPSILRAHARNAAGDPMPEDMLQALLKAQTFNQGYQTVQQLSSAILDMRLHSLPELPANFDASAWEAEQLRELGVPSEVGMRHRLSHFSHLFDGGYSASYYAYTWAEAMDADGFDAFVESGNVFDPNLARKLREEVLERGNTRDPAESYIKFRGRLPTADALLRNRGLK